MNRFYYLISASILVFGLSGHAAADDCTVTGDSIICAPDGSYNPADHGGRAFHDYENVELSTTIGVKHGIHQVSGDTTYNNVTITTSGSQADGVHVLNWAPKITFNNLNINAYGYSSDGILVGRDSTGTIITVNGDTRIFSLDGMGVRSVTTAKTVGIDKNTIILNGNSFIETVADGSKVAGYGVYAGVDSLGCGPFGLPIIDCLSNARAEIFLSEGNNNKHSIITSGKYANGIYAFGYGYVKASNIHIETSGEEAHGIAAVRRNQNYYYDSSNSGGQDYSGVVELTGDVYIKSSGSGAFAIFVDSHSAANGEDSLGVISSVRSFDSDTGQVVSDKVYEIDGNLYAKNSGIIDLSMGDYSTIDGHTKVDSNGIIKLSIYGDSSYWNMDASSSLTNVNLLSGATLRPYEIGGNTYDYTIAGQVYNSGKIVMQDPVAGSRSGDTITIAGNYSANNGLLVMDTTLHDDTSSTDLFVIDGDTSGDTRVQVFNAGGIGAKTDNGIKIIGVTGSSAGTFSLLGDFVFEGDQAVVGGAYAYRLYKGQASDPNDGNWYLHSTLIPKTRDDDHYQPGAPTYESYAQSLLGLNGLPTLQQRVGNRFWAGNGNRAASQEADTIEYRSPTNKAGTYTDGSGVWGRIEGAYNKLDPKFSTSNADHSQNVVKMQVGVDVLLSEDSDGSLIGGVSAHYTHGKTDIHSIHGKGAISTNGYGAGGTLTWYGNEGFYVDGQGQATWYSSDLTSVLATTNLVSGNKGFGYALSLETGKRYAVTSEWSLTPQAQMVYSNVDFDNFVDIWDADVSLDRGNSLEGRLGLSLDHETSWQNADSMTDRSHVYGIANLYYGFSNSTKTNLANTEFRQEQERLWGGLGVGASYSWNDDKYSIYGEGLVNTSLESFGDSHTLRGTIGFRVKW